MAGPEQSLKIKDLIFIILRAWRQVIAFAVIGVILLAGFALYRGRTSGQPSNETVTLTDKEIEEATKKAMEGDPVILKRTDRMESLGVRSDYLSGRLANSVYLSINEEAQPVVTFDVVVTPEQPSPESEDTYEQRLYLLSLEYLKIAKGDLLVEYLASHCMRRVEGQWIMELLTFRLDENRVLHFETTAPDLETAESLAEAAGEFFTDIIREHLEVVYLFDVVINNRTVSVGPNPLIKDEREWVQKELDDVRLAIDQEQEAIDLRVEEALDQALEGKISQLVDGKAGPATSLKRTLLKYGIAGAFIGILIAAFIAVFRATSSAVIWSPEEFADHLKLLYVGTVVVPAVAEKKAPLSGIDRWLEGLFYGKRGLDAQESIRYVTSIIEGLERKARHEGEAGHPYTVAVMGETEETALGLLVDAIGEPGSMRAVGVVADKAEGIKALRSADAVVQLVQARRTKAQRAVRDLELAVGMGIQILGIIGLESVQDR